MDIAAAFIALPILIIIVAVFLIRKRLRKTMDDIEMEYPKYSWVLACPAANFFGVGSLGMKQLRGNGILLATSSRLYFRMLIPRREVLIQFDAVTAVSTPKVFLGKTKGSRLLQVDFTNADGESDSAAWMVRDLDKWVETVTELSENL